MSDQIVYKSSGVGFLGLLALVFIACKLTGFITWSWWWVLSPFWGPFALVLAFMAIVLTISGLIFGCAFIYYLFFPQKKLKK